MEHVIATWIVAVWQRRRLGEYAPGWDPGGDHSPNSLFAASFAQAGFAMEIPSPELFYELLPVHYVQKIDPRRGVKIRGLWYDGPALTPYRGQSSTRGGKCKGKWVIHCDPKDRRRVFFQDPLTHDWHPLPWTGLPPNGQAPAFGDARVRELLKKAEAHGLRPRTDDELLPVLLELVGSRMPVSQWKTQMPKAARSEHAREVTQAAAAQADRPSATSSGIRHQTAAGAVVTPLRWLERAREADVSIDSARRHRREQAVQGRPKPPPPLGASLRNRDLFLLPEADEEDQPDGGPTR